MVRVVTLSSNLGKKANVSRVSKSIAKNSSQKYLYSEFQAIYNTHAYLLTALGNNSTWKYAGILYVDGTRSNIQQVFAPSYLTVSVDSTGITITNGHQEYDMTIYVEIIGSP